MASASGFHILTKEPGQMPPVRRIGGASWNLDVNNTLIFALVGGRKDSIVIVSALLILKIMPEWSFVFNPIEQSPSIISMLRVMAIVCADGAHAARTVFWGFSKCCISRHPVQICNLFVAQSFRGKICDVIALKQS